MCFEMCSPQNNTQLLQRSNFNGLPDTSTFDVKAMKTTLKAN